MGERASYVVGGGGHGRVVIETLLRAGGGVAGLIDPVLHPDDSVLGVAVLGGDETLDRLDPAGAFLVNGVGANPDVGPRRRLYHSLRARGFEFPVLRHPGAIISPSCALSSGAQIMAGAVVQGGATIGENAVVNTRASVDHDSWVGAHAFIAPGAVLCGDVRIDEGVFVGAGAILLPGVRVGAGAVIAAGAVVTRNVDGGDRVAGNPARSMRSADR